mmetsp:Transcript_1708/g.3660  ORF Transcript_1708/g.3660 Transcript_1708/m.3660 type:complete len:208 (+) Transcript_1708:83-706(+)|eukprot:CAMPEP_0119508468 /NCGR_PEP_ID=MMETSP1344-20130328/28076_1 /TAXON_ID=236787 /ORGANISM="Florenciella parvula, Strain CCMP2471" /LENGTH=207 /DNA_ID=CAMNT_0007545215 /DNA_START=64 /DNA_END=687 /DNA_ORIENTATION=+
MKFRFCGDLDAPDWLLAEIATLSKVNAVRMKVLVKQVVQYGLTGEIDYEKVSKMTGKELGGHSDTKGVVAALHFVLSQSAKYDIDDTTLQLEIQQLGLPKENADALARTFRESKDALRARFAEMAFRVNTLATVEWRVDQVMASSSAEEEAGAQVHLKFAVDTAPHRTDGGAAAELEETAVTMSAEKFQVFHHELRQARAQMAALEG